MSDSVLLSLGLNLTGYEANLREATAKQVAFERGWIGLGKTFKSVSGEMKSEQEALFSALDRLTEAQQRGQLERLAGFQPEIILQREILGLQQSIANIEGVTTEKLELQVLLEQKILQLEKAIAAEATRTAAAKEAAAAVSARAASKAAGSGSAGNSEKPGDVEAVLQRKLGVRDALKGLVVGAGIGSVQAIAEALVSPFKSSSESAQKIAEYIERSVTATRALLDLRLTDAAKIKQLEQETARELREAAKPPEISGWQKFLALLAIGFQQSGLAVKALNNEQAIALQKTQAAASVQERAVEIARLRATEEAKTAAYAETRRIDALAELSSGQKVNALKADSQRLLNLFVAKNGDLVAQEKIRIQLGEREREIKQATRDFQKETNLTAQEQIEIARLHLISLARPLNVAEAYRLEILKLQSRQLVIQSELAPLLEKGIRNLTPEERKRFETLVHQSDKLEKQIDQKQKIIDATKQQAKAEELVGAAIESNLKAWEDFKISVTSFGRGNRQLSDLELKRKREETEKDIFQRELAQRNASGPINPYDPLLEAQRANLQQVLNEIGLRSDVRKFDSAFGFEAAFKQFPFLTEFQLREILNQTTDKQQQEQQTQLLQQIANRMPANANNLNDLARGGVLPVWQVNPTQITQVAP